jgi:hypothetical protein
MQANDTAPQPASVLEDYDWSPEDKALWDAIEARVIAGTQDWLRERQERRENRTVIPIKLQIIYWIASAFFVGCAQLFTLALFVKMPYLWGVSIGLILYFNGYYPIFDWFYMRLLWLILVTTTAGATVRPTINMLSPNLPTYRQMLLVHWCFCFFIVSEFEWRRHLHRYMRHPIHRDSSPADYLPTDVPNVNFFSVWTARFVLTYVISCTLAEGLNWIGDIPGPRPIFTYWCANALFNSGWVGQLFQALVLLRPHRHFTAWIADSTWTLGETLWHRIHSHFNAVKDTKLE